MSIRTLAASAAATLGIDIEITGRRAYHYATETRSAYWLTAADLRYAKDCAAEYGSDAYSHWCSGTGREMSRRSMRSLGLI